MKAYQTLRNDPAESLRTSSPRQCYCMQQTPHCEPWLVLQVGTSTQRMLQLLRLRSKWLLLSRQGLLGTTMGGFIRTEHGHGAIVFCDQ